MLNRLIVIIILPSFVYSFHSSLCCCGCERPCPIQHRSECGAAPETSCSDVVMFNKSESLVACKAIIGVWIANGFPVDESIEGSTGRRHVLLEMRDGKELSLVTLESRIDANPPKKDEAITSFSIDSVSNQIVQHPLPSIITPQSGISLPRTNQGTQNPSQNVLGYNWRLGADQQWKLAPITQSDDDQANILQPSPQLPQMLPSPQQPLLMNQQPLPLQSPMIPPQLPFIPPQMNPSPPMIPPPPPSPSLPVVAWTRFNQALDGFSSGFSSMADKVLKIFA